MPQQAGNTYLQGLALIAQLHGNHAGQSMIDEMKVICPDFATMTIDWAFGGVMARPGLDLISRQLVLIASCVTLGHAMPQLRAHVEAALQIGASKEQIIETILQLTFYAGGPAVRNALVELKDILTPSPTPSTNP
ncbi:carboxymuconolactone decarboxylase family protein [Undibacterium jejuense]|uniref:Carboxymuconolactone decarboxylase family protein n=1 Tax=Undibacterium jejuense TaxID=1344949 RepID=A0A923HJI5_9BURK|nr:carboxymuconolactone decarboxylase family protein [Undibacterium jejuense]MBC3863583.1 carboxymuconolactone decarboxylase family protein [Undibacterium jejuense]